MADGGEMCPTPLPSCLSSPVIIIIISLLPPQLPSLSQRAIVDGSGGQTPSIFLSVLLLWGGNLIIPNVRAAGDLRNIKDLGL